MTIPRRMQIAAVVLLLSAVGGILLLFWNSRQVGLGIKEIDTTAQIADSAFLLRILMGEFLNGGNKKSLEQWAKQNQRLGQLLNNETLAASTDPDLLRQIRKSYDSVKNLYPHVIEMRTSTENESGDLPAEKLLNSLILLQLEQLVNGASDLSKATQSLTIERRNFVQQLIVTLGILAVVIILIYIYQIRRSVVNPLTALSTTAERIGEGNYDFIPDTKSDDEVGKLAQSFNTMVQRLRERSAALKEAHDKLVVSVEERTTALHTVRAQNEVLQAVQRSQTQFISEKSSKEFFGSLLHDLLTLTNSEFGFIGEVLYSEDGRMYLRDRAIMDVSWDEETRDRYQRFSRDKGPDFYNVRGLWGTVIQTGEPVISNDPANDSSRSGMPDGHPPLDSFLGLPFLSDGKVIGMAGIANRPGGYDNQVVDFLQPYLSTCASLIQGYRNENRRREAEQALKESEERLRLAQSSANIGIWERHLRSGKLIWTEEMERIYGYVPGTFPGTYEGFSERVHPDDLAEFERLRDEAVNQSKPFECDFRIHLPSGETRWINCKGAAHYDETESPDRVFGVNVDITERKQAEQALKESEARLKQSQAMAHLGSWELDVANNTLTWSDEVYRIFGLQPQEFEASYETFLEAVHPDDRKTVDEAYSGSLREGKDTYEIEHRLVTKSTGEVRIVQEKCEHIRDLSGRIIRSVGMVHDITERKRAELEIREMNESLENKVAERTAELSRSNEDLQQFAYVASHDLQEPLRNVASCLQLLEKKYKNKLDANADQYIHHAVESSVRMKALILDLLAYSRVGTKGKPPQRIDCEQILDLTVRNLRAAVADAGAVITRDPLPIIPADDTQLLQVFQNLIGNAIKFRRDEPPQVHVSAVKNKNEWIFSVKDNGIGIESRHLDRIFVIFQRLHKRSQYDGTGMGLAIVKKVVERHNGRVWVESEFGSGTTFYFTIPEKGTKT